MIENDFFSEKEECDIFLKKMSDNNFGCIHNGYFIITDEKLHDILKNTIDSLFKGGKTQIKMKSKRIEENNKNLQLV